MPVRLPPIPILALASILALTFALLLPAPSAAEIVDRVVLRVNDRIATFLEFEQRRNEALAQLAARRGELDPQEMARQRDELGNRVFRKMFEDLLLLSRADQLSIYPTEEEVDQAVTRLREGFGIQSDDEFAAALSQEGMSLAEFREQVRTQLRIRQVIGREVTQEIEVEEDDLRRAYRAEEDAFVTPQRWRVRELIVLEGDDRDSEEVRSLARSIRAEVVGGRAIDEVASQYAEEGLTSDLVDHGWVQPGELAPALESALEALQPGDVSEPIEARGGYHIMEVQEREDSRRQPFSEVEDQIERRERQRLFAETFDEYMQELEEEAYVVADPPPSAAGFRTVAGERDDVDPFAAFEPVSEDEDEASGEAEAETDEPEQPEIEIEPSKEEGPPP